jgi:hypothetical protein
MDKATEHLLTETLHDCFGALTPSLEECSELQVFSDTHQIALFVKDSNVVFLTPPLQQLTSALKK